MYVCMYVCMYVLCVCMCVYVCVYKYSVEPASEHYMARLEREWPEKDAFESGAKTPTDTTDGEPPSEVCVCDVCVCPCVCVCV
jgi:hypothetical protein